jgi:hypothetical protein
MRDRFLSSTTMVAVAAAGHKRAFGPFGSVPACMSHVAAALEMALKTAEARAKGFQFAREREDAGGIIDLPNPLPPRRLDS